MMVQENYAVYGENIIYRGGYINDAVLAAKEISNSENHSWAYLRYTQGNKLLMDVYYRGKRLATEVVFREVTS